MRPSAFVFAQGCATATVLARVARGRRRRATLRAGTSPASRALLSVVIPARNEALRIGASLDGLRADPDIGEIIVVDDRSSDATAEVARAGGARVVSGRDLPAGWCGKAWSLQQGLEAARGDDPLSHRSGRCARLAARAKPRDRLRTVHRDAPPAPARRRRLGARARQHDRRRRAGPHVARRRRDHGTAGAAR
jgi:glycosyltransferase involved in cell wall biosynthesis